MHDDSPIQLTPLLCLTASLLYMVQSDGVTDDHESSQIQSVLGGQEDILALGLAYVKKTPVDEFLSVAAPLLKPKDAWCVLTNICDSLLSDGQVSDTEKSLFLKFCSAFEVTEQDFASHDRALRFKNNKRKLGDFSPEALSSPFPPAHLSLAACLLYMMAADGDIAEEEIGQLQLVIGEFEGLQEVAMQQVRCMKLTPFLRNATPYLNDDQRLFILVNVYDSMLSDGVIKEKEQLLFETMQDAFAIPSNKLAPFLKTIEYKNHKPKLTQIDKDAIHVRQQRLKQEEDDWNSANSSSELGETVQRTIDHNTKQVSEGFNTQDDIDLVALNANNQDARVKIKEGLTAANVQKVKVDAQIANIQQIDVDSKTINIQQVGLDAHAVNIQPIDDDSSLTNRQALPDDHLTTQDPQCLVDSRMDSLQMNVTQVHQQLDLITPRSTWQKLDTFFKRRPLPLNELALVEEPGSVESTGQTPELLEDKQAAGIHNDSASNQNPANSDNAIREKQSGNDSNSALRSETDNDSETGHADRDLAFTAAGIDGGIRLRTLLMVVGISVPLVGYAYGLIYPTMVCQGPSHQWQKWTPDGDGETSRVINDQTTMERHLIQIRRGEISVTNQRFPLYKELNQSNHFAQQTDAGFKGSYSTHTVDQMKYNFDFSRPKSELRIETESAGIRYIDGQSGHIEVFSVFKGTCENRWF
jgi:uncharacterized tellurite resistance protein B-like protein